MSEHYEHQPGVCDFCGGTGAIDTGESLQHGGRILIPCYKCDPDNYNEVLRAGTIWKMDSSLERWFPFTAEKLGELTKLNQEKFDIIQAYCRMASKDKWKIRQLLDAIEVCLDDNTLGKEDVASVLTDARDRVLAMKSGMPADPERDN